MKKNMRRPGKRMTAKDRQRYMRMIVIPAAAVLAVIFVIVLAMSKAGAGTDSGGTTPSDAAAGHEASPQEAEQPDAQGGGDGQEGEFVPKELQKDGIPEINMLVDQYFQAKLDKNGDLINQLYGMAEPGEEMAKRNRRLEYEAQFIEDYQNIVCYTKPGLHDNAYIVYVSYEVKFRQTDTPAPGIWYTYVTKGAESGYMLNVVKDLPQDVKNFIKEANQSEDVRALAERVNAGLRESIEADRVLASVYKAILAGPEEDGEEDGEHSDSQVSVLGGESGADGQGAEQGQPGDAPLPSVETSTDSQVSIGAASAAD